MRTLITAFAAASLLLAAPAFADRDSKHQYRGVPKSERAAHADHKPRRGDKYRAEKKHKPHRGEQHRPNKKRKKVVVEKTVHKSEKHRPRKGDRKTVVHKKVVHKKVVHHEPRRDRDRHHKGKHRPAYDGHRHKDQHDGYRKDWNRRDWERRDWYREANHYHDRRRHGYRHKPHHWPRRVKWKRGHRHHHGCHHWRPTHYHYGYHLRRLPTSFISINVGGLGFYYNDGVFYRPYSHGYTVVQPPMGAVVYSLPATAVTISFSGRDYYVAYDTYYQWDDIAVGFRVVANPGFY